MKDKQDILYNKVGVGYAYTRQWTEAEMAKFTEDNKENMAKMFDRKGIITKDDLELIELQSELEDGTIEWLYYLVATEVEGTEELAPASPLTA